MDEINKIYLNITLESKINWIKQNNLKFDYSPIVLSPDRYNSNDIFFVNNDLQQEHLILEDVYKKSLFKDFILKVKNSEDIDIILLSEMKQFLGNKLKPIKHYVNILICKFNFNDLIAFIKKINKLFGENEYKNNQDFYFNKLFLPLQQTKGACWRISETNLVMFFDINNLIDITIIHECIHYIQVVTERSILHQKTKLEKINNMIFTESEAIAYINSLCHIMDGHFIYNEVLAGFNSLIRERQLSISKNEQILFDEFYNRCLKLSFISKILLLTDNMTPIIWLLTCIFENKHIDLIRSHLIFYFK